MHDDMRRKIGNKIMVKSEYFNPFNGLYGVIIDIDDFYQKFTVKIDDVDSLQVFDRDELTKYKP